MKHAHRSGYRGTEKSVDCTGRLYDPTVNEAMGVVLGHGATEAAISFYSSTQLYRPLARYLTAAGYPVTFPDLNNPNCFGNDGHQQSIRDAGAYLQSNAELSAASGKYLLVGASMATLGMLLVAANHPSEIAGVVGLIPVPDLVYLHDVLTFAATIESAQAYGSHAGYLAALPSHNPAQRTADFTGMPGLLFTSSDDPAAVPAVANAFASAVGWDVIDMGPHGHAFTADIFDDVVRFLDSCGGR